MLIGIIAALVAVLVLSITAFILYFIASNHSKSNKNKQSIKSGVDNLKTVGIAPDDPNNPDVRVKADDKSANDNDPFKHLDKRFKAVKIFIVGVFCILGAKVFSMQMLSREKYEKLSIENSTVTIKTPAPRGNIFDCNGKVLVKNKSSVSVLAEADVSSNTDVMKRLSVVLGIPYSIVRNRILDQSGGALSRRVVANNVSTKQIAFISEHKSAFDGITIEDRTIRDYPYGALAAHVLGYTGIANEQELLENEEGRALTAGDIVGKNGVESYYDSVLSGDHGQRVVVSDADGNIVSVKSETNPAKGSDLYLTINAAVQYKADSLLAKTIAPDGIIGTAVGSAGSVVVMDVEDGSIISMSNYPTYKPGIFTNGISQDIWKIYNTESSHNPLLNRAIAGTYPAASTFKAFTGLAGLNAGCANLSRSWECKGQWDGWDTGLIQKCWNHKGHGGINFRNGIIQSCDIVFYEIGKYFFDNKDTLGETAMQDMIMKFNFGRQTEIDLEGEEMGRVPTPKWKAEYFKDIPTESNWVGGDNANMAIGQGYVLITPIQLAVAYGAIATGKLIKPHVFKEVKNDIGDSVSSFDTQELGEIDVNPYHLDIIRDALHGVGTENSDVAPFFKKFEIDAAAKTGTAEVAGKNEFGWTVAYAPFDKPKYVVSCIIEEGGGGSGCATPIASEVLKAALDAKDGKLNLDDIGYVAGSTGKSVSVPVKSQRTD